MLYIVMLTLSTVFVVVSFMMLTVGLVARDTALTLVSLLSVVLNSVAVCLNWMAVLSGV